MPGTAMHVSISIDPTDARLRDIVRAAQLAEEAGASAVSCYDHLSGHALGGGSSAHVWASLGAIALATERVRIGPLVVNATTRHPADIANAAATLQDLSDGRLVLGMGAGASGPTVWAEEMRMFHLPAEPAPRRRARLEEAIAFLRALWDGAPRFEGVWASFTDVVGVARPEPRCPIVVGANGAKVADLAVRCADGVNFHFWQPDLAELVGRVRAATVGRAGGFSVSVEAPLDGPWLDPASAERAALAELGVDELVLAWRHGRSVPSSLR